MVGKMKISSSIFPLKLLVWIVIAATLLFMFEIWYITKSYELQRFTISRNFRLLDLSGSIVHLQDVLSMCTRMSAYTGEKRWEDRYHEYKPKLDAAIMEVKVLSPDIFISANAMWLDSASNKLEAMHNMAFDFINKGRVQDASILLNSKGYERQEEVYAKGIQDIALSVKRQTALSLNSVKRWLVFSVGTAVIAISVLLFILVRILYLLNLSEAKKT